MLKQSGSTSGTIFSVGIASLLLLGMGCQKREVSVGGPVTSNSAPSSRIHLQAVPLAKAIETYKEFITSPVSIEIPAEVLQKPISAGPFSSAADDIALLLEASFRDQAQITATRNSEGQITLRYEPTLAHQR